MSGLSYSKPREIAKTLALSAFALLLITGLTAGLAAGACRNGHYVGSKKLTYCNISIWAGSVFPGESAKRSALFLERGIALSELGRKDGAKADFKRAMRFAAERGCRPQPEPDDLL